MSRQEEFERLALVHAPSLLRAALRLTRDSQAAEDLVQDSLLRAWRFFDQFERGTNIKAWLFRIMLNLSSRRLQNLRRLPLVEAIDDVEDPVARQVSSFEHSNVLLALDELPEEFRVVLILAVVEGFTCNEISKIMSVPMGTVMSRLSRARKRVRELLERMERKPMASSSLAQSQRGGLVQ